MPKVIITTTLATTRRIAKYGGVQIAIEALEQMRDQIQRSDGPLHMNHRAAGSLQSKILGARIERISDAEHALLADFEVDEDDWAAVESDWKAAGAPGGFSVAVTEAQEEINGAPGPAAVLISDASAYTDEDRAEAARLISEVSSIQVLRLFQFSEPEFAKIALEFSREVGAGLLVSAICFLVGRRSGVSHVEMRRIEPDGTITTAVLDTDNPEIVRAAAQSLDSHDPRSLSALLIYNEETDSWEAEARTERPLND
jgi:hypothetical protein